MKYTFIKCVIAGYYLTLDIQCMKYTFINNFNPFISTVILCAQILQREMSAFDGGEFTILQTVP